MSHSQSLAARYVVRGTWYIFMRSSISISISVTQLELIIKMTYNRPRRAAGNDHGLIVNCLAASRLDFDCPPARLPACRPGSCCCCTCCTVASCQLSRYRSDAATRSDPMIYAYIERIVHKCAIIHNHKHNQSRSQWRSHNSIC